MKVGFKHTIEVLLEHYRKLEREHADAELIAAFYEADNGILGHCDDSSGYVGDVFRYNAKALFVEYASHCSDKEKVADILLKLNRKNDYGVRDSLIDCAGEYLSEPVIRTMIATLQQVADDEKDGYKKRHHFMLIESLTRQIKDAKRFEQPRIASFGKLSTAAITDIASVYLESGEVQTALSWLNKVPEDETFKAYERNQLLLEIYRRQGDDKKLTELLYQKFRSHHSTETLQKLLVIAEEETPKKRAVSAYDNPNS